MRSFTARVRTLYSTSDAIEHAVAEADLVIGAVLVPGAAAPKLVTAAMVRRMRAGAVMVDIAIDQGGCFETSRPTTHAAPVYVVDGVIHYCVTNMPGAVPRTSAFALNNATLPYVTRAGRQGLGAGHGRGSRARRWPQYRARQDRASGGGPRARRASGRLTSRPQAV